MLGFAAKPSKFGSHKACWVRVEPALGQHQAGVQWAKMVVRIEAVSDDYLRHSAGNWDDLYVNENVIFYIWLYIDDMHIVFFDVFLPG